MKTKLIVNLVIVILFVLGCKKDPERPSVKIGEVSNNTGLSASIIGEVLSEGESPVTERGFCWSQKTNPNLKENDGKILSEGSLGIFSNEMTGLAPGKLYYVRAFATNNGGTGYSKAITFSSLIIPPILKTAEVTSIASSTATSGGEVTNEGGATVTERGVCWGFKKNPTVNDNKTTDGTGLGVFTSSITGLVANSAYFVRAYATNIAGTGYGTEVLISTVPGIAFNSSKQYGSVDDIDGNTYKTIQIGTQTWMAENLRVTKYRNGELIPEVNDTALWVNQTSGASCNYDHNLSYMPIYGKLYNWHTIKDTRNIAPVGWHVPSDAEWETLKNFLGNLPGNKLKENGTKHWKSPNTGATNESGFSALPGGFRYGTLGFMELAYVGAWWSSNNEPGSYTNIWSLTYNQNTLTLGSDVKTNGYSIRCIKD